MKGHDDVDDIEEVIEKLATVTLLSKPLPILSVADYSEVNISSHADYISAMIPYDRFDPRIKILLEGSDNDGS